MTIITIKTFIVTIITPTMSATITILCSHQYNYCVVVAATTVTTIILLMTPSGDYDRSDSGKGL